jgi:hypothetical protein
VSLTQLVVETSIIYATVKIQTLKTLLIRLKDEIEISNQIPLLRREFHLINHHTLGRKSFSRKNSIISGLPNPPDIINMPN